MLGKTSRLICYKKTVTKTLKRSLKQWILTRQTRQLIGLVELLGVKDTVQNFDHQVHKTNPSSSHSHKSFEIDERIVLNDLRDLKPFDSIPNHKHDPFQDISADPPATIDQVDLDKWLKKKTQEI